MTNSITSTRMQMCLGNKATQTKPTVALAVTDTQKTKPKLKLKPKPKPTATQTTQKAVTSAETLEKHSSNLTQIEDETAAEHADTKTPKAPVQERQLKKGKNVKEAHLFGNQNSEDDYTTSRETDDNLTEGSDINGLSWKKQKAGHSLRNAVQAKQTQSATKLTNIEEKCDTTLMAVDEDIVEAAPEKGKKVVKGRKEVSPKKGAANEATNTTEGMCLPSWTVHPAQEHWYRCAGRSRRRQQGKTSPTSRQSVKARTTRSQGDCKCHLVLVLINRLKNSPPCKDSESLGEEAPPPKKTHIVDLRNANAAAKNTVKKPRISSGSGKARNTTSTIPVSNGLSLKGLKILTQLDTETWKHSQGWC